MGGQYSRSGKWQALARISTPGLIGLLALCWVAACGRVDPVIKIGLVGPFEGKSRSIGYDVIYSARLAVREINAAGGIDGYRVALEALDDGGDPGIAAEVAASLVIDPAVVVVVGHWLPETDAAAAPVYQQAGLAFVATGGPPFVTADPDQLPVRFREAYQQVTPFDEQAGPYAGPAYDAFQLLWLAFVEAAGHDGRIDRPAVDRALSGLRYDGMSGVVYRRQVMPDE